MTDTRHGSPGAVTFLAFASGVSLVSVLYLELVPRVCPRIWNPYVTLAFEGTNTALYFGGFIAYAVFLGTLKFCRGTVCLAGRAESVVAAAAFCAWIASTILTAKTIIISRGRAAEPQAKALSARAV